MEFFLAFLAILTVSLASVAFSTGLVTLFVAWIYQHPGRSKRSLKLIGASLLVSVVALVLTVLALNAAADDFSGYDPAYDYSSSSR